MNNYLVHHGILGQKYGVRNGPPYPLDYSKLSKEERAQAKQKAIETGNIKEAGANIKFFTNSEIDAVINRFNKEQTLKDLNAKHVKTGKDKIKNFSDNMALTATVIDNTSKAWNSVAKVSNSLFGSTLPIIKEDDKSRSKTESEYDKHGKLIKKTRTTRRQGAEFVETFFGPGDKRQATFDLTELSDEDLQDLKDKLDKL